MENKVENKKEVKLLEGQKLYPAVYLNHEHLSGTSKEGKAYDIGKVQFQLIIEQVNRNTGDTTVKKPIVDTMCDTADLPVDFNEFEKCYALYEMPVDPSYEKARVRFVKLVKA